MRNKYDGFCLFIVCEQTFSFTDGSETPSFCFLWRKPVHMLLIHYHSQKSLKYGWDRTAKKEYWKLCILYIFWWYNINLIRTWGSQISHWTTGYPMIFGKTQHITNNEVGIAKETTNTISGSTVFNKYNLKCYRIDSSLDNG